MRNKNLLSFNELISEEKKNDSPYRLVVIAERRMVKKAKKNDEEYCLSPYNRRGTPHTVRV